jgi:hypothetical protein
MYGARAFYTILSRLPIGRLIERVINQGWYSIVYGQVHSNPQQKKSTETASLQKVTHPTERQSSRFHHPSFLRHYNTGQHGSWHRRRKLVQKVGPSDLSSHLTNLEDLVLVRNGDGR